MIYKRLFSLIFSTYLLLQVAGCTSLPPQQKTSIGILKYTQNDRLPIYDINTPPISVWIIKDAFHDNTGFIVTGHAAKAVCEVATLEVMSKLNEMGKNPNSMFSFGIAFDFRPKSTPNSGLAWTPAYHSLVGSMENRFRKMAQKNPKWVQVNIIDQGKYEKVSQLIKKHIQATRMDTNWDTQLVEYKNVYGPIIVPFYQINTGDEIHFNLPKSIIGAIPSTLNLCSIKKTIRDATKEINTFINNNKAQLASLKEYFTGSRSFKIWTTDDKVYALRSYRINNTPPIAPEGFVKKEYLNGMLVSEEPITIEEAIQYRNQGRISIRPNVRQELDEWIERSQNHEQNVQANKGKIEKMIIQANTRIEKDIEDLAVMLDKFQKVKPDESPLLDAFLRGWPFSTDSDAHNHELDRWFEQRPGVWKAILDQTPGSRANNRLAGVFHQDNVFFQVVPYDNYYDIKPYYIVGGDFVQVIDKSVGIARILTSYNFR